jgi:putative two-component system response regulator
MHDVGKIGIPDHILLKPGSHTPEEWEIMKIHSILGAKILDSNSSPYLKMGAEIALTYHERWDGSGYPQGLKGEAIPLSGRIMNICDQYDALRSKRPYKLAFDHDRAVAIITQGDGRTRPEHFDPVILATFQGCTETFREIYATHADRACQRRREIVAKLAV